MPGLAVVVRRLHDIGRTGWWAVLKAGSYAFILTGATSTGLAKIESSLNALNPGLFGALLVAWLACALVMLVFMVTSGMEGTNQYGPDPHGPDELEQVFA
ncbi:MAG: DUF805 domain-containing protein [Sphingomicrobium sp.]